MACCVCCFGSVVCCKLASAALKAVRNISVRSPCPGGAACKNSDPRHLANTSHPDDADYGYSVRVHGGRGEFCTLRTCFNFMDPLQSGYVSEPAALRELLHHCDQTPRLPVMRIGLVNSIVQRNSCLRCITKILSCFCGQRHVWENPRKLAKIWKEMDTDGNGYIDFPEFVEWAISSGANFGLPQCLGMLDFGGGGAQPREYSLKCSVVGCECSAFCGVSATQQSRGDQADPFIASNRFCSVAGCGHRHGIHAAELNVQLKALLPSSWASAEGMNISRIAGTLKRLLTFGSASQTTRAQSGLSQQGEQRLHLCSREVVEQIQQLVNASVRQKWTRDRGKVRVPSGYKVVRVEHNTNARMWLKYSMKRALIREGVLDSCGTKEVKLSVDRYTMRTSGATPALHAKIEPLQEDINEWLLWHGASAQGARHIAEQEFKQLYAGSTTGTLYGKGTYFSDSCTKADEYAKETGYSNVRTLLLCRVTGGRVRYTDEVTPNAAALENCVFRGPCDSVLGDREKARDTFKEIVIYDSSQAYPEFLVHYEPLYE
eukprot:TRINITY_DN13450_c0_g2_i1.p1 TRINITY_DN13450_c0_g2~~TRINITY_DN13450_c0_g2_i1.p1  ORF type:complete len:566 (+),score=58.40 TRINITY_DN13450_c0_g2_i1:65-1699(+)